MIPAVAPKTWEKLRYWAFLLLGAKAAVVLVAGISSFVTAIPGVPEVSFASLALVGCFIGSSAFFLARGYWFGALSTASYAAATISSALTSYRSEGITVWTAIVAASGIALLIVSLPLVLTPNPYRAMSAEKSAEKNEIPGVRTDV